MPLGNLELSQVRAAAPLARGVVALFVAGCALAFSSFAIVWARLVRGRL
jgi:hypothetical protein